MARSIGSDTARLLYSVFEHINYCRNILLCLLPSGDDLKTNRVVKAFDKGIKPYRDHIGAVVNCIKHNQRRVRALVFYGAGVSLPGYYLETIGTISQDGKTLDVMQADPEIHANADTAFSFARDLRFHLANLYLVSRHLATAVLALTPVSTPATRVPNDELGGRLFAIATRVASLPPTFYPDEVHKAVPYVEPTEENGVKSIRLECPSVHFKPAPAPRGRITIGWTGDGVTDTFKVPYVLPSSWR